MNIPRPWISISPAAGIRRSLRLLVLLAALAALPTTVRAQCVVDVLNSPAGTYWKDMALCRSLGKVFIADETGAQILVYDMETLAPLGAVSLAAYLPDRPQNLVVHEDTHTLYVAVDQGWATSTSRVVVIDAGDQTIQTTLTGLGIALVLTVDEARDRLYAFSTGGWDQTLTALDVHSNGVVGSLNVEALLVSGIVRYCRDGGLNPVTGEMVFTMVGDQFAVVDGPNMTGTKFSVADSGGWTGIWNYLENKICITTSTWEGYFTFDRDTGTPGFAGCINDGTDLFFNPATDRVYSGAEIDGNAVVIEGPTDACQEISLEASLPAVAFAAGKHHLYFVGWSYVRVLDEDTFAEVAGWPIPGPGGGGLVAQQAIVDPDTDRVFVRSYRDLNEGTLSCLMVVDDRAPLITTPPASQTVWYGETATLDVAAAGVGALHYQWYAGERGDTSHPVGGDGPQYITPPLAHTGAYWVEVRDSLGAGASDTATITVDHTPGVWTARTLSIWPPRTLYAVQFIDSSTGWAVGNMGTILKTSDGGASWALQESGSNRDLLDVWFVDPLTGWAVGGSVDGVILHTVDGGATWTPQTAAGGYRLFSVRFFDATTGWAVGMLGTLLHTTDGGANWELVPSGTSMWFYDVSFVGTQNGWVTGSGGTVLRTFDGGEHWTESYAGTENDLNGVFMWDAGHGLIASADNNYEYRGRVFRTDDGGATWTRQDCDAEEHFLTAVHCANSRIGWVTGSDGLMMKTTDAGAHWFVQPTGTLVDLNDVFMRDIHTGWAVGGSYTILRYTGEGRADVNGDGLVDGQDLALVQGLIAGNHVWPGDPQAGDVNRDGRVDVLDVLLIRSIMTTP